MKSSRKALPGEAAPTRLLTKEDVADLLQVSARTVQRMVDDGRLKAVHLGRLLRFHPAVIEQLLLGK